jgi:uncharacterized protein (UPF0303 family)
MTLNQTQRSHLASIAEKCTEEELEFLYIQFQHAYGIGRAAESEFKERDFQIAVNILDEHRARNR